MVRKTVIELSPQEVMDTLLRRANEAVQEFGATTKTCVLNPDGSAKATFLFAGTGTGKHFDSQKPVKVCETKPTGRAATRKAKS